MLNFNDVGGGSAGNRGGDSFYGSGSSESALMSSEPKWKVLVYDAVGQAILAPIFSVKQLRDSGVTLHILIDSQRYRASQNLTELTTRLISGHALFKFLF